MEHQQPTPLQHPGQSGPITKFMSRQSLAAYLDISTKTLRSVCIEHEIDLPKGKLLTPKLANKIIRAVRD